MRLPKRGEKGFTLIELLIVVAILGVLAAVVIPNIGRFMGAGQEEAAATELANIQTAVVSMMVDNGLSELPVPVTSATSDMSKFPDATSSPSLPVGNFGKVTDPEGYAYTAADDVGYLLFSHDIRGNTNPNNGLANVNYVATGNTTGTYTVVADGTVTQESTGY